MSLSKTDNRRRIIAGAGAVLIGVSFLLNMLDGLTNWWVRLNWIRAVLYLTAFLAALRALSIPPEVENNI